MTDKIRTFRYVGYADIPAYLELGWIAPECRPHRHMDVYRVVMEWGGGGEPVEPRGAAWPGAARHGGARPGKARQGKDFQTVTAIGQFEAGALLRANRIADKLVEDMEYERAAEDASRRRDAAEGFEE